MSFANSVVVTGHHGFLGGHTTNHLSQYCNVKTYDGNLFDLDQKIVDGSEECFFHFAGYSYPAKCNENPLAAYENNFLLTEKLLSKFAKIFAENNTTFVFFSTAHVYDMRFDSVLNEESPLHLDSIYAKTKYATELLVQDICTFFKTPYLVIRLFNTTHRTQTGPYFMPTLYSQLLRQLERPELNFSPQLGSLDVVRDFMCLQDFLSAMDAIVKENGRQLPANSGTFNLCSGVGKNLLDIVNELSAQMNVKYFQKPNSNPSSKRIGDPSKFSAKFHWTPKYSNSTNVFVKSFLK